MLRRRSGGGGGGTFGGLGGPIAGAGITGGLSSFIGMLSGGNGMGNTGGLLDRVLSGKF